MTRFKTLALFWCLHPLSAPVVPGAGSGNPRRLQSVRGNEHPDGRNLHQDCELRRWRPYRLGIWDRRRHMHRRRFCIFGRSWEAELPVTIAPPGSEGDVNPMWFDIVVRHDDPSQSCPATAALTISSNDRRSPGWFSSLRGLRRNRTSSPSRIRWIRIRTGRNHSGVRLHPRSEHRA